MARSSILLFVILVCWNAAAAVGQTTSAAPATAPAQAVVQPPARESFDIYLLMGQSNMVGRDTATMDSQVENPRILSLNEAGKWVVARDPLHPRNGRIDPGVGPGLSFAATMLKSDPGRHIGLVPCAVGGTGLNRWVKGADLYEQAVARAKIAAQSGVIKGMLWHQGESDTNNKANADSYEARLTGMLRDLRADLGAANLPIVVGQLGTFLTEDKYPFVNSVRATLARIPTVVPHAGYADSAGLGDKGDQLHFNAASQKQFGARYAAAMQALLANATGPATRRSAGSQPAVFIAKFAGNRDAAISYTFDDNLRDQYTLVLPMLKEVAFKGTFFVIAGKTAETPEEGAAKQRDPNVRGKWGGISWPELKEMAAQGHEIASHTWSHAGLTRLSAEELDAEISKAYESIKTHIGSPPLTLAFPGNGSNPAVQAAALKYHVAFRSFQEAITDKSTIASLNAWADTLIKENKWGVMMTHALVDGYAAMSDPEIFRAHLKYVKSIESTIWVDTFANVSRYNTERENAQLHIRETAHGVECTLLGTLDPAVFNVPLTIVLPAPGATNAKAVCDGTSLRAWTSRDKILVEAVPGPKVIAVEWTTLPSETK